jgi:hypothetical protein
MELINPKILWGLAAIAAPILIHFWNQKQARNVDWAAMKWLVESQKLKAKGFRFEDLLLLILRILAFIILVLIVAKPLIDFWQKNDTTQLEKIHILAKDKATINDFKFEINEALTKKESVYFIDNLEQKLSEIDTDFEEKETQLTDLQNISKAMDLILSKSKIILYVPNDIDFKENPNVFLPKFSEINFSNKTQKNGAKALATNEYIYVNTDQKLTRNSLKPSKKILEKAEIKVAIETSNPSENNSLKAALEAIKEVYGFPFIYDKNNPELAIGKGAMKYKNADLIILTNGLQSTANNVISLNENPNSGNVFRAELPTQILEILLNHYQMVSPNNHLSKQQLKDVFNEKTITNHKDKTLIDKYLGMLFLGIVLIERWISLKNNK